MALLARCLDTVVIRRPFDCDAASDVGSNGRASCGMCCRGASLASTSTGARSAGWPSCSCAASLLMPTPTFPSRRWAPFRRGRARSIMDGQDPGTNQRPALQVTSAMQSLVPGDWDDDQAVLRYVHARVACVRTSYFRKHSLFAPFFADGRLLTRARRVGCRWLESNQSTIDAHLKLVKADAVAKAVASMLDKLPR